MNAVPLAIFSGLGTAEFIGLVILGILLYGKNLPTVARTVGRTIGDFKRHMKDVEDQIKREAFQDEMRRERPARPPSAEEAKGTPAGAPENDAKKEGSNGSALPPPGSPD
ncbi:MAG: twin-arginine translocase TatA/TatE family subunit [Planctomycetes bacterium]|nr:twin-arginine translocase TatA/TatE family subunit [Planctomycetota bacterium]